MCVGIRQEECVRAENREMKEYRGWIKPAGKSPVRQVEKFSRRPKTRVYIYIHYTVPRVMAVHPRSRFHPPHHFVPPFIPHRHRRMQCLLKRANLARLSPRDSSAGALVAAAAVTATVASLLNCNPSERRRRRDVIFHEQAAAAGPSDRRVRDKGRSCFAR